MNDHSNEPLDVTDILLGNQDQAERRCSTGPLSPNSDASATTLVSESAPLVTSNTCSQAEVERASDEHVRSELDEIPWPLLATKLWMLELLAIYLGVCTTTLLITLLLCYDNKPLGDWKFFLSLNTIVSILGAFTRVTVAFVLSSCLGQHKWNWIRRRHDRIKIFELFDEASRGPWGSIKLLSKLKLKEVHLPALGSLAMVLLLAFDPFLQALLSYRGQLQPTSDLSTAAMPATTKLAIGDTVWVSEQAWEYALPDDAMSSAILSGAFYPEFLVKHPLLVNCPTGNCTWPEYSTIALCTECVDVSPLINTTSSTSKRNTTIGPGRQEIWVNQTTMRLSYGNLEITNTSASDIINMNINATTERRRTYSFRFKPTLLLALLFMKGPEGEKVRSTSWVPSATECSFHLCTRRYSTQFSNYVYEHNHVKAELTKVIPGSYQCTNKTNASLNCDDDNLYTRSAPRTDLQLRNPVGGKSPMNITQNAIASITESLLSGLLPGYWKWTTDGQEIKQINGSGLPVLSGSTLSTSRPETMLDRLVKMFWRTDDLGAKMANIAEAMTNSTRNMANEPVIGESLRWILHFDVRWGFIAFPLGLQVLAYLYFVLVVCQTGRLKMHVWKERLLPTLLWGFDQHIQEGLRSSAYDKRGLDKIAEGTIIHFATHKSGIQMYEKR